MKSRLRLGEIMTRNLESRDGESQVPDMIRLYVDGVTACFANGREYEFADIAALEEAFGIDTGDL